MLFLGYTRFSLFQPNSSAWQASNNSKFTSEREYKNYLFSEERLDIRTNIFINELLPIIDKARGKYDIFHVVAYSDLLPNKYKKKLIEAKEKYNFLILLEFKDNKPCFDIWDIPRKYFSDKKSDKVFGYYRVDDDDLLSIDYFEQMSTYINKMHVGWIVSLATGITAIRINDHYYNIRKSYYPMLAIGLLSVCQILDDGKIIQPKSISHSESDKANPVILDSRNISYLWVRHLEQDTAISSQNPLHALSIIKDSMQRYQKIADISEVENLFPTISNALSVKDSPYETHSKILFKGEEKLNKKTFYNLTTRSILGKNFELFFKYQYSEIRLPKDRNLALVSFRFIDKKNQKPIEKNDETIKFLQKQGIFLSTNPNIGFYKYLTFTGKYNAFSININLPPNIDLDSIGFMKWGNSEGIANLNEVSFFTEE